MVGASGGVTLLSPPTPGSSGAGCWGGGCSRPRCHGNHPNPHFPKHKETALTPAPRKNLGLVGNLPWGTLFLMQEPRPAGREGPAVGGAGPLRSAPPHLPRKLSCPSPTAKAALGLLSCSDHALSPYSFPEARDPHCPQQASRLWERRGGGHPCHPPSAPLRHYSLGILPPPSAR